PATPTWRRLVARAAGEGTHAASSSRSPAGPGRPRGVPADPEPHLQHGRGAPPRRRRCAVVGDAGRQRAHPRPRDRQPAPRRARLGGRHFATGASVFLHARSLSYEELEALENAESTDVERMRPYPGIKYAGGGPVPAGRREALEIEIERLSAEIAQLVRERPI